MKMSAVLHVTLFLLLEACVCGRYTSDWDSLDSRPLPSWYDEAKFGIFLHWGVYSVPSFQNEWFWEGLEAQQQSYVNFMQKNYANFKYQDFAPQFKAELFNPKEWADIFQAAGAKYVVLTSKHHEGFCNWNTKYSFNWNSVDVGANRDLVKDLAEAVRNNTDLHFGLYFSLYEWFNPLFNSDMLHLWLEQTYVINIMMPQLKELVNLYEPDIVWSDGDVGPWFYFNSTEFLAWLYNDSPVKDKVVVNDRWGAITRCQHGGFFTCRDRYLPKTLPPYKWENCFSVDRGSFGFRRDAVLADLYTTKYIVGLLVQVVSLGGNLLLNVGPTADGRIMPIFEERLRETGKWLAINGEAIYSTKPWRNQTDYAAPNVWYTSKMDKNDNSTLVYAIFLQWPTTNTVTLAAPVTSSLTKVFMVGIDGELTWLSKNPGIVVTWPKLTASQLPSQNALVIKMLDVK
jgi:alpha-L-fucosidase